MSQTKKQVMELLEWAELMDIDTNEVPIETIQEMYNDWVKGNKHTFPL